MEDHVNVGDDVERRRRRVSDAARKRGPQTWLKYGLRPSSPFERRELEEYDRELAARRIGSSGSSAAGSSSAGASSSRTVTPVKRRAEELGQLVVKLEDDAGQLHEGSSAPRTTSLQASPPVTTPRHRAPHSSPSFQAPAHPIASSPPPPSIASLPPPASLASSPRPDPLAAAGLPRELAPTGSACRRRPPSRARPGRIRSPPPASLASSPRPDPLAAAGLPRELAPAGSARLRPDPLAQGLMSFLETKAPAIGFDIGSSGGVHDLALCLGDVPRTTCAECIRSAGAQAQRLCSSKKELDACMLRYSGEPFFDEVDDDHSAVVPGGVQSAARSVQFENEVAGSRSGHFTRHFSGPDRQKNADAEPEGHQKRSPAEADGALSDSSACGAAQCSCKVQTAMITLVSSSLGRDQTLRRSDQTRPDQTRYCRSGTGRRGGGAGACTHRFCRRVAVVCGPVDQPVHWHGMAWHGMHPDLAPPQIPAPPHPTLNSRDGQRLARTRFHVMPKGGEEQSAEEDAAFLSMDGEVELPRK
ncbi:cysteine-rich repeat secretory protein 38-like [Hordeum vulgare]|nr:cysteine-rich repeat secretory protein 38-like [Hordeum vulgare]